MTEPVRECLDPKIDLAFKALFGREESRELLVSLLNAILDPAEPIREVEILNPFSELAALDEKLSVLDLKVRDRAGKRYAVEMQCHSQPAFSERILYYAARLVGEQLGRGRPYTQLEPVVVIVFTNHVLLRDLAGYHSIFELLDRGTRHRLTGHLRIDLVELPKFKKRSEEARSLEEQWIAFLKEGNRMSRTVLEGYGRPELVRAREELERLTANDELRQEYEDRIRYLRDYVTDIEGSFQQGFDQGIEKGFDQGIEKGIERVARRLLGGGMSIEETARLTGLSSGQVERLGSE